MITECPFYIQNGHGCSRENGPTYCYVRRDNYTKEQNQQNEYQIGDYVLVHFYKTLAPGVVVHRRGKWGCKVMFADSLGKTRCSNAVIHSLVERHRHRPTNEAMLAWVRDTTQRQRGAP